MRIAVPVTDGKLAQHFGHCECFALLDVDPESQEILSRREVPAPPHQPGLLPRWLAGQNAQVVIAGGMGQQALRLFAENGINVIVGAGPEAPEELVAAYFSGALRAGENACDH